MSLTLTELKKTTRPYRYALLQWRRVLAALLYREMKTRYGESSLGFLSFFIEPLAHILVVFGIWTAMGRFGLSSETDPVIFLATGIIPFFIFRDTFSKVLKAVDGNRALLTFPQIKILDYALARAALELLTYSLVFILFMAGAYYLGRDVQIIDINHIITGCLLMWLTGLGAGLTFLPFVNAFPFLEKVIGIVMRVIYLTSGVIYSISKLPLEWQEYAAYNPFLHILEYIRTGFFPSHAESSADFLDMSYCLKVTVVLLISGLAFKKTLKHMILE